MRTAHEIAVAFVLPIGVSLVAVAGFALAHGAIPPVGAPLVVCALVDAATLAVTSRWGGERR